MYDDFTSLRGVSAVAIGSIGFRTVFSLLSATVEVVGAGAFMAVVVFSTLAVDVGFTTVACCVIGSTLVEAFIVSGAGVLVAGTLMLFC